MKKNVPLVNIIHRMTPEEIQNNTASFLKTLPPGVTLVVAGKTRSPQDLCAAYAGGARIIGHNYVQEAERSINALGRMVQWHCIGHIQRNKVKKAVGLFDLIETIDSMGIGIALENSCAQQGKIMPVFIEVNSAEEPNKTGVKPEKVISFAQELSSLPHIRVEGLMTMGPWGENPEECRPYFRRTKELFEQLKNTNLPSADVKNLSMGMSSSYLVAIEEGATMVRIGTRLFGSR